MSSRVHPVERDADLRQVVQQVVEQDLHRQQRQERQDHRRHRHRQHVAEVRAGPHADVLAGCWRRCAGPPHAVGEHAEAVLQQDQVGGGARTSSRRSTEMPTSAAWMAGASLTPSPRNPTAWPRACRARMMRVFWSGETRAEQVDLARRARQRAVVQLRDLRAGEHARPRMPSAPADMPRPPRSPSPDTTFTRTPARPAGDRGRGARPWADPRRRRSRRRPGRARPRGGIVRAVRRHRLPGDAPARGSPARLSLLERARALARAAASSGRAAAVAVDRAGTAQHRFRRALDDQDARAVALEPAPRRAAARSRTASRRSCASRASVDARRARRIASSSGLRMPVSKQLLTAGQLSTRSLSSPSASRCRTSAMRASVSVPVLSVHSTSMAPRSWMAASRLTTTRFCGHAQRAARQRHRHDHRQQLGREPDRQRHREQERLQHGPAERQVHQQDEQHEEDGEPQDQQAEPVDAALERARRRRAPASAAAMPPKRVAAPVATTSMVASPPTIDVAGEQRVERFGGVAGVAGAGALFDRIGLAGHQRLVDVGVAAFEQIPSAGTRSPARARPRRRAPACSTGMDATRRRGSTSAWTATERFSASAALLGPVLLHDIERDREHDDDDDDGEAGRCRR